MTPKNCATPQYRRLTGTKAMTKKAMKKMFNDFMKANKVKFDELVDKALNCGALDLQSKNQGDVGALQIVLCYVFKNMMDSCQPMFEQDKKELKNLLKF
jgi:hypothetical protein